MARIRKFIAYRRLERPYTRVSKYKKKSYVKANPHMTLVKFEMGDPSKKFSHTLNLVSKTDLQIRYNALESARQTANRLVENKLGKKAYFFKFKVYPHHVLRENPLAAGAGADRMSTGMSHSFGKAIGRAARVKKGQTVLTIKVNKQNLSTAKTALKRASHKLPNSYRIEVVEK